MEPKEQTTRAQAHINEVFAMTGTLTSAAQDLEALAHAMASLGMGAAEDLHRQAEIVRNCARTIAKEVGGYIHDQANGKLYLPPEAA